MTTRYLDPSLVGDGRTKARTPADFSRLPWQSGDVGQVAGGVSYNGTVEIANLAALTLRSVGGPATLLCGDDAGLRLVGCGFGGGKVCVADGTFLVAGSGVYNDGTTTSQHAGIEIVVPPGSPPLGNYYLGAGKVTGCYAGVFVRGDAAGFTGQGAGIDGLTIADMDMDWFVYFGLLIAAVPRLDAQGASYSDWRAFNLKTSLRTLANGWHVLHDDPNARAFRNVQLLRLHILNLTGDPQRVGREGGAWTGVPWQVRNVQNGLADRCWGLYSRGLGEGNAAEFTQETTDFEVRDCVGGRVRRRPGKTADANGGGADAGDVRPVRTRVLIYDTDGPGLYSGNFEGWAVPQGVQRVRCVVDGAALLGPGPEGYKPVYDYSSDPGQAPAAPSPDDVTVLPDPGTPPPSTGWQMNRPNLTITGSDAAGWNATVIAEDDAGTVALRDFGRADGTLSGTVAPAANQWGVGWDGVIFRATGFGDFWMARREAGQLQLYKFMNYPADEPTLVDSAPCNGSGAYGISVSVSGPSVQVSAGGVTLSASDPFNQGATKHGFWGVVGAPNQSTTFAGLSLA